MIDSTLNEIVKRILKKVKAQKIILFGSRVRGNYTEESDYDLLVICDDFIDVKKLSKEIYSQFIGINKGVDVIIRPEKYINESKSNINSFIGNIINEGEVIYG
jgi:predicted nucleotidyltransferase